VASHENSAFTLPVLARAHKDTIAANEEKSGSCSSVLSILQVLEITDKRSWIFKEKNLSTTQAE